MYLYAPAFCTVSRIDAALQSFSTFTIVREQLCTLSTYIRARRLAPRVAGFGLIVGARSALPATVDFTVNRVTQSRYIEASHAKRARLAA